MFIHDLTTAKAALISGLLLYGAAQIDPVAQPSNIIELGGASEELTEAGEAFNAFSVALPTVLLGRVQQVATHGTKALLAEPEGELKEREELMIQALIKGLQLLGESFAEDTTRIQEEIHGGRDGS